MIVLSVRRRLHCTVATLLAFALGAGCGDSSEDLGGRESVKVVQASPTGLVDRTTAIEVVLSKEVTGAPAEGAFVVTPPLPLDVRWTAPNRLTAIPKAAFSPNTRYVVRLLPSAVGKSARLERGPAIRFNTPLFAVEVIDGDARPKTGPDGPSAQLERIWIAFSHPVAVEDIRRFVVLSQPEAGGTDLPYEIRSDGKTCRTCDLVLIPPTRVVDVEIAPELRPVVGGTAIEKPVRRRLDAEQPRPFRMLDAHTEQDRGRQKIVVRGNRTLADPIPDGAVRVEPDVGHRVQPEGRTLVVEGGFEPDQDYQITITAMAAQDGSPLAEPFDQTVHTPPLHPELAIVNVQPILAPSDDEPVEVDSVGVDELRMRLFSVPIDNLVHVLDDMTRPAKPQWPSLGRWSSAPLTPVRGGGKAGPIRTALQMPDAERPGLRLLEVRSTKRPWLVDRRWIQAGWVLSAKQGVDAVRVQVLSAAKRQPIRGAEVRLRTGANHPVGPVVTDGFGVAVLAHDAADPVELVVVTKQGDTAVLDLTQTAVRKDAAPLFGGGALEAFVLPAQDRFRRGDPLPVLVVVRKSDLKMPPDGLPMMLRLRGPSGRVYSQIDAPLWRSGGVQGTLTWPARAVNGVYTVEAVHEERVIGEAKVRLQGQQAPVEPPVARKIATSTGSTRLSWTPERPRPGQALQVRWLAPAAGWVTLSLESTEVLAEVRKKVGAGPKSFSLTVPRTTVPGAHLNVTFEPLGGGTALSDRAYIEVGGRRPLRVRLDLPPGPHRSGSEVLAKVRVRGQRDRVFTVLRIVSPDALDDRLADDRNLTEFFQRYRPPSWRTYVPTGRFAASRIERLMSAEPQAAATLTAAGVFMTEAYPIGKTGERKLVINLPQRQGKLRVEAVVWSPDRHGTATTEIEVRDPLAIDAGAPLVLTAGDSIELPVTLYRGAAGPASVQLSATTQGGLEVVGDATQQVEVDASSQADRVVRVAASQSGALTLVASTPGGESVRWRRSVSVRPVGPPQVVGVGVQGGLNAAAALPWPSLSGRSRVPVGALPLFQVGPAITRLARADRDDLETAAARALARQVVPDLSRSSGGGTLASLPAAWFPKLDAVERCLSADGVLAWPEGPRADPGTVILAGHAVVRAARRRSVSPNFDRWMDAVRAASRSGAAGARTVAYGQWVLALARRPDLPMLQQLQTQWASRPPDLASGVGLAAALTLAGRAKDAAPLLKFTDSSVLDPSDGAFVLAALADASPKHPAISELSAQLVSALSGATRVGPRTDALAVVGFAAQTDGQANRPFVATLKLGDKDLRKFQGAGWAVTGDFDDAARSAGELKLNVTRGAPVYASLVVEGPTPGPGDGPLKVGLQLLNAAGEPVTSVQRGDRLTMVVTAGPLPSEVPDLRVSVPIPSGLTVTRIEAPSPHARLAREPGVIAFDQAVAARSALQIKLHASATYAGDFAMGPVIVSSSLRARMWGASQSSRLKVK